MLGTWLRGSIECAWARLQRLQEFRYERRIEKAQVVFRNQADSNHPGTKKHEEAAHIPDSTNLQFQSYNYILLVALLCLLEHKLIIMNEINQTTNRKHCAWSFHTHGQALPGIAILSCHVLVLESPDSMKSSVWPSDPEKAVEQLYYNRSSITMPSGT